MRKNRMVVLFSVAALVLASLACKALSGGGGGGDNSNSNESGFSFTTANITNAHLALDVDDKNQTTTFSPNDSTFYCFFDLNNAPDDTMVKGVWTLVSADGYTSDSEIDSAEITGSNSTYYFSLDRSSDPWPIGKYKIDLYINDKLVQTLEFEVK